MLRASIPRQGVFNLNRFGILVKQVDCLGDQREFLASNYIVRDELMVRVVDSRRGESAQSEPLLLL